MFLTSHNAPAKNKLTFLSMHVLGQKGHKPEMIKRHVPSACLMLLIVGVGGFLLVGVTTSAVAQDFHGLLDAFSPFFSFPRLEAEARVTPIWTYLLYGKVSVPGQQLTWDLKDDFALEPNVLFLDSMVRIQIGRLSFRTHYNVRDYKGSTPVTNLPNRPFAEARFDYSGLRLGGDFDVLQWGRSRVGVNMDYDLYSPTFTASINQANPASAGKQISGAAALTLGMHLVYNPTFNLYGISAVGEARARWPISGTEVTDWEVSGGLKSAETALGSVALRSGYRRTSIEFHDTEVYNNVGASTVFDAAIGGWFGELVYYY
jgi:hypothetical protein